MPLSDIRNLSSCDLDSDRSSFPKLSSIRVKAIINPEVAFDPFTGSLIFSPMPKLMTRTVFLPYREVGRPILMAAPVELRG